MLAPTARRPHMAALAPQRRAGGARPTPTTLHSQLNIGGKNGDGGGCKEMDRARPSRCTSAAWPSCARRATMVEASEDTEEGKPAFSSVQARARALRARARRSVSTLLSVHFAASSLPSFWIHGKIHGSLKVSCRWRTPHIKLKGVVCLVSTDRTAPTHGRLGPPAPCWRSPTHPFRWRGSPGSRLDHQDQTPPFPVLNLGEVSRRTNGQN